MAFISERISGKLYNEWGFDSYDLKETIPDSSAILDILEYTGTEKIEIKEQDLCHLSYFCFKKPIH